MTNIRQKRGKSNTKEAAKRILKNRETIERAEVISTRLELECIKKKKKKKEDCK
jgi:hypothetical protein